VVALLFMSFVPSPLLAERTGPSSTLLRSATSPLGVADTVGDRDLHARTAPQVRAVRIPAGTEVVMDGIPDEAAWELAPPATGLTQMSPREGEPASQRTEVRFLFDDEAIYVGARMYDDGPVNVRLTPRDGPLADADWLGIGFDSQHDHQTAYVFDVSPAGVQRDAIKRVGTGADGFSEPEDMTWNAVWEAETQLHDWGWSAELRIPFSQLPLPRRDIHTWGLQLERLIGRTREYSVFAFVPRDERGGIPRYAHLLGIQEIEPGQPLELQPYAVLQGEAVEPGDNPFRDRRESSLSAGLDLRYRLHGDLVLTATLNPDFGQVEVDPAVVNLGVYETFFEERRPFFLEGLDVFDFGGGSNAGGQLFYTRRIGRSPQVAPPSARADTPRQANILGAAKVTGRTDRGWRFGLMEAVTARAETRYLDADNTPQRVVAEPRSNYAAARARRDLRNGASSVGGMLTSVIRESDPDRVDLFLPSSAWAGGLDLRHEWGDRRWLLRGSLVGTRITGHPDALVRVQRAGHHFFQRPDAPHLAVDSTGAAMTGYSASATLVHQVGRNWQGQVGGALTSPTFEVNDMGFGTRTDRRDMTARLSYSEASAGDRLRSWGTSASARYEFNFNGERIANWHTLQANATTLGFLSMRTSLTHSLRSSDDRRTRGGPMTARPARNSVSATLGTDHRRAASLELTGGWAGDEEGGWEQEVSTSLTFRPSTRWELKLSPSLIRLHEVAQYVATLDDPSATATFGRSYLFSPLDQTTVALETRFNYIVSSTLSVQLFAQPFISAGDYGEVGALDQPGGFRFDPWDGDPASLPERDFNLRSLRGNAVLRWEWRPGSVAYLAWQQTRQDLVEGIGDFDISRDRSALFRTPSDNIVVLKVSLWMTP
jgi:hypothetical protein